MRPKRRRNVSFLLSIAIHALVLGLAFIIHVEADETPDEFVEIGFGSIGEMSANEGPETDSPSPTRRNENPDDADLPETEHTFDDADVPANQEASEERSNQTTDAETTTQNVGDGSSGAQIAWMGSGSRRLLHKSLPEYPSGESGDIRMVFRVTVKPDGTVGGVTPLTRGGGRFEEVSVRALWRWRFEKLKSHHRQVNQVANITFVFRQR